MSSSSSSIGQPSSSAINDENLGMDGIMDDMQDFENFESQLFESPTIKSYLDLYLEEKRLNHKQFPKLGVLEFWKTNQNWYGELYLMV